MKKQVSMTKKYHNGRPQTTLRHREEETQTTDNHNTIKVKQPALSSSARWLPN